MWQKAHELAKDLLTSVKSFPNSDEARIVKRQLVRAILSVPSNIAEGYGGYGGNSYRNYLVIARRSMTESDYWLFLARDIGYIDQNTYEQSISLAKEINAMLTAIINKLEKTTQEKV